MSYTILVVEDEKEIADAVEIYLRTQNYEVIKAEDGLKALEIFEKEKVDLILMDLMMPVLDGVQTTLKIREKIEINPKEPKYLKVVWGIGYKFEKDHK